MCSLDSLSLSVLFLDQGRWSTLLSFHFLPSRSVREEGGEPSKSPRIEPHVLVRERERDREPLVTSSSSLSVNSTLSFHCYSSVSICIVSSKYLHKSCRCKREERHTFFSLSPFLRTFFLLVLTRSDPIFSIIRQITLIFPRNHWVPLGGAIITQTFQTSLHDVNGRICTRRKQEHTNLETKSTTIVSIV